MPHRASHFEDQSTESGERSPHCTWCAIHAFRLQDQERFNRGRQEPYGQGDSSSSVGEERRRMCSRRKTQNLEVCEPRSDSSDDESLSEKGGTAQCRRYGPDVQGKCSPLRNSCVCSRSEGKVKMTGTNARCARCPSPEAELLKIFEHHKSGCDHEPETADGAQKNFRQIVTESRCPCLCAYLHFTDTVDTCTCVRLSPCGSVPHHDSTTANVPDDCGRSPSPNDKTSFRCCIARYFSPFRKRSKRSKRDVNTRKPSPLSLQQKTSQAAGDTEIAEDTRCHQDLDRCGICQICCRNSEMMKNIVSRKPSQRESYQSANVQRDTDTHRVPRESTAVIWRDSCLKCRRDNCGLGDAEKEQSRVRCTCDCESRNKDLKKFRSSLHRICRALSGCKRSSCTCDCHGQQGDEKGDGNDTRVPREEVKRRRKGVSRGSGEKKFLPKRGLLALKYQILRCKEDGNSNDTDSSSSDCEWNKRGCHRRKQPPETEQRCSNTGARRSEGKLEKCCGAEKKKCTRKACNSKNDSHKTQDGIVLKANHATEDKEMNAIHRHPKEKVKQKRCSSRKNKLANAQRLHERDLSERSADDSSDESELDAGKNRVRKEYEIKTNPKYSREEDNGTNDPILDPVSAEVVKIGDRYYQAICHRTAHVNIMSFKNLKDHRDTHRRRKGNKSPRIEVRLKYDTTSSEEDSSEAPVPSTGPQGDSACYPSKPEQRKGRKRKTAPDKPVKKAVRSDTKEAKLVSKKRHHVPTSTGATGGHGGISPTSPVTRKHMQEKEADRKHSSCESIACDFVERLPKAMTEPPPSPGKAESPVGWRSEGSQMKRTGVSARTLELKQMSDRWFSNDAKQWGSGKVEAAGDAYKSGTCDVRPFTASSSAS